ncbi:MAG TPA: hypothetical protein VJQ79_10875 [Acidimicrobiia bacterium]|nr:hypothetical protein [Acidimicrobiia bacterium]
MADFDLKLQQLSERGRPLGAEELIERIEAELAGNPLVVAAKRKDDSTRTDFPMMRRLRWAVAAMILIVAALGLYWAFLPDDDRVVATTTTTTAPLPGALAPLEVIEEAVAAFYSGDGERAAELFELTDRTDDQIRMEAAYQAAIGGRLTLNCPEFPDLEVFLCNTPYQNVMTDAVGYSDEPGDRSRVVVENGIITAFGFPEHSFLVGSMGAFLTIEGRFDGYENCLLGPFPETCAVIQMENLDAWADWYDTVEPATFVEAALQAWYGGDCEAALFFSGDLFLNGDFETDVCSTPDSQNQTIEYESILGASVSLQGCEDRPALKDAEANVSCEVHYSNAMSTAVGKPASVTAKEFSVRDWGGVGSAAGDAWYSIDYPEDLELRESFRAFAESGELADEYSAANCALTTQRTPECATLIIENLDAWAAWYASNG